MRHELAQLHTAWRDTAQRERVLIALVIAVGYVMLAIPHNQFGWVMLVLGLILSYVRLPRQTWIYYAMIAVSLGVVYLTPFSVGNSIPNIFVSLFVLMAALAIPYVGSHRLFKHSLIHFRLSFRGWSRLELMTFAGSVGVTITFLAAYFLMGDAYKHWQFATPYDIVVAFTLIMLIGMWEEFYFIASVFGVLKKFLPVFVAAVLQALMFSAFLYQFGFQGWIVPFTFMYALAQSLTFYRFRNLALNVSIHFCVDLAVFILLFVRYQVL